MRKIIFLLVLLSFTFVFAQNKTKSIGFIENKGQIVDQKGKPNPAVKYLLNTAGLNVQLRQNGFSYDVYETKKHPLTKKQLEEQSKQFELKPEHIPKENHLLDYSLEYIYHRIDIDFQNSNRDVELVSTEKSTDYDNYYNVPSVPDGITMVHKYQEVTYKEIYPNIDVVFFIPKDSLKTVEYNFVVRPGGKINDIKLKFNGVKTDLVDNKIKMKVRFGEMEETLPMSWTEDQNTKTEVAINYTKIKNNIYGFESTHNISDKTVIIDPVPIRLWGTYYGGVSSEEPKSIKEKNGFLYHSGSTASNNNIASAGAWQNTFGSVSAIYASQYVLYDFYIVKFDLNGNRIWGTYFGGDWNDYLKGMDVSNNDNIYIFGSSNSITMATPGTYKDFFTNPVGAFPPPENVFAKFDTNGFRQWSSYVYGSITGLVCDVSENIYFVGETDDTTHISTIGSFQPIKNPLLDAYIMKFDTNCQRIWGTYYGGEEYDHTTAIKINSLNNLIIVGFTRSLTNISSIGAPQFTKNGLTDIFILEMDLNGNRNKCTYFGGENNDYPYGMDIDNNGNTYISGITHSFTNISTPSSYQYIPLLPTRNGFILKFDNQFNRVWGTYFHKPISGFSVNNNGEIYFASSTSSFIASTSVPLPTTANAHQVNPNDGCDAYLAKFNTNGQLDWGTFYGSNGCEHGSLTYSNNNGDIYFAGSAQNGTGTGVATPGSHQPNFYVPTWVIIPIINPADSFIVKFKDCLSTATTTVTTSPICPNTTIQLSASGGTGYSWTGPNGFTSLAQNPTIANANAALHNGVYTCNITGTGGCDGPSTVTVSVGSTTAPIPTIASLPTITGDCNTVITVPTATTTCLGTVNGTTTNPTSYPLSGTYSIVWNYSDGNGHTATQNQTVIINAQPLPTAASPQNFCFQDNKTLADIVVIGQNIKWYAAANGGTVLPNPTILIDGTTYFVSQTISSCESNRIPVLVNVYNTPAPTGSATQTFCASVNPTINNLAVSGTTVKWYAAATGGSVLPNSTALVNGSTYYASQILNGCESPTRLAVTVVLITNLPANDFTTTLCDNLNDNTETIDLSSYNSNLISNPTTYTFEYYNSQLGAQNQTVANQITNFTTHNLTAGNHIVYVRILSTTGCYKIVELKFTVFASPILNMLNTYPLCIGKSVTVNAGAGFSSYTWSNGIVGSSSISITTAGNYWVTVTQNHGSLSCTTTKNFTVFLSNPATITSIDTQDWTDTDNVIIVNISNQSIGNYLYSLDGINYQTSNQFSGLNSGFYTVFVKDDNKCGEVKKDVFLLMYPKFFTPNGDGINDYWKINFSNREKRLKIQIFNRFGELLTDLPYNKSWDGTYNGIRALSDDYWFVVTRDNGTVHKGHFSLIR